MFQNPLARVALVALFFAPLSVLAQKNVVSAYNAQQKGNLVEAAGYIEKALLNEKAIIKEKTWRYRGDYLHQHCC